MKIKVIISILLFLLYCDNKKMRSELVNNSPAVIEYFYNSIIKAQKYDLLDNIVINKISPMFGYDEKNGTWEYEGNKIGFKNKIKEIQNNYGHMNNYIILSNRYFFDTDNGIHNFEFIVKVEYEKRSTKEKLILGCLDKECNSKELIKIIAYSSY